MLPETQHKAFGEFYKSARYNKVLEPKTMVRIEKARFRGGGDCRLWFDGAASTFYNWADRPVKSL